MTLPRAWVLLHGTPLDRDVWSELAAILGEHQAVLAPEVTPPADDHHPQSAIAQRLATQLEPVADQWDVVGHSFGGQIAIELALLAPSRVSTLSIICSRDSPFSPFAQTAAGLRNGTPIDADAAMNRWFRPHELRSGNRLVAYARERLETADRDTWASALDAIATYDRTDRVHTIEVPTTLICAGLDPVSDPAAMTALRDRLPNAQLHVLADAAHMSPFLNPAALAARLPDTSE